MAQSTPKYERLYREGRDVCGPPFPQLVAFFDELSRKKCRVLDLGCGQGRDALFIARKGHTVLGVDVSATGIAQMLAAAREEGLAVSGVVADIVEFEPEGPYDVVLLDRVLHMLPDDDTRFAVLEKACRHTSPGGFILIADTPKNMGALQRFFQTRHPRWEMRLADKGCLFVQRERDLSGTSF